MLIKPNPDAQFVLRNPEAHARLPQATAEKGW